ncbi:zinc ribbon domain-containing protein [Saprospira grandis]|uniref:zinc ribbon domain-containing protein n=1 Tax=Saprospira grandis TaxID=1008 RepID=UPI0022DE2AF8|nr:C4-type zinc ribbon domain-containing protein [Saprospira grandis]WBM76176.1 C4-type zinc ribbon domain-containing protein [Saprospira grandis]
MAKKKTVNVPVEEKLQYLFELQELDSKLHDIERLKGELPMEVSELEDEIVGLETRVNKLSEDIKATELKISKHQNTIKEAEVLIEKYGQQQENVNNNREYDALSREIELQKLDIQLSNKRIKEAKVQLSNQKITLDAAQKRFELKKDALDRKQAELEKIIVKTEKEEKTLDRKIQRARKKVEERLLKAYDRIRGAYKNKLAVVTVERNSCGGCFNHIPPQTQLEINQRKRIIICEHCGRVLVDRVMAGVETVEEED